MEEKKTSFAYKIIRRLVLLFYPKTAVSGAENLPDGPCIAVGNHTQMNGPIVGELYYPGPHYIWCAAQMMDRKEVPAYAYQDFWSGKPKYIRWYYKLASYLIAPLAQCIFTNAHTIPVYHDTRLLTTFRLTIQRGPAWSSSRSTTGSTTTSSMNFRTGSWTWHGSITKRQARRSPSCPCT